MCAFSDVHIRMIENDVCDLVYSWVSPPEYWDSLGCPLWPLTPIQNNAGLIENMYYIYCRWINFQSALCKLCNIEGKTTLKVNVLQVSQPVMAIIAVYTALNLRSSSQIWWANSSSASNRHHCRSNKVEKGHWPRKHWGEKESRATAQTWINPSLAFRLCRKKNKKKTVLQFWRL